MSPQTHVSGPASACAFLLRQIAKLPIQCKKSHMVRGVYGASRLPGQGTGSGDPSNFFFLHTKKSLPVWGHTRLELRLKTIEHCNKQLKSTDKLSMQLENWYPLHSSQRT